MLYLILFLAIFSSGCDTIFLVFPHWFDLVPYPEFVTCLPAVLWGVYCWFTHKSLANSWAVLFFLLVAFCSLAMAASTEVGRGMVIFAYLSCAVFLGSTLKTQRIVNFAILSFLFASLVHLVLMFYLGGGTRLGTVISNEAGRVSNPNAFGSQMAFSFLLTVACFLMDKHLFGKDKLTVKFPPIFFVVLAGIFFLATFLSGSRGATLALMATCAIFLLGKEWTSIRIVAGMGCLLFGVTLFVVEEGPVAQLTERFRDTDTLNTMGDRLPIWRAGVAAIQDNWKTGVGIGGVEHELGMYLLGEDEHVRADESGIHRRAAHNTYLEWFLSTGIVGAIAGFFVSLLFLRNAIVLDRQHQTVFRRSLIVFLMMTAMTTTIYRHHTWLVLGALTIVFLDRTEKRKRQAISARSIQSVQTIPFPRAA